MNIKNDKQNEQLCNSLTQLRFYISFHDPCKTRFAYIDFKNIIKRPFEFLNVKLPDFV